MFGLTPANPPMTDWHGKHVWIIGASAGIGFAVAKALVHQGATLTLSARNLTAAAQDSDLIQCAFVPLDICDHAQIGDAIAKIADPVDVVMIFAGSYHAGSLLTHSSEAIDATISTNFTGVVQVCHQLLPILMTQGFGHLVLVGSSAAYLPMPNASVYGASKAALRYFAQSLYTECKPNKIAISLVSPGFVKTRLTAQNTFAMPSLLTAEQASEALLTGLAAGKFDIAFPMGFTLILRLINALPWRWRQVFLNRLATKESL